jgi:hypothetical protein
MANERRLDQLVVYAEHDQGLVERRLDQLVVYAEHDQGLVERRFDQLVAYVEWSIAEPEGRKYGPALAVMGM